MNSPEPACEHRSVRRPLAPGVFLAMVGEDAVVLDLRADAYGCLPDLADRVRLVGHEVEAQPDMLAELGELGLLGEAAGPARRALPPLPARELEPDHLRRGRLDSLAFVRAVQAARRLGPHPAIQRHLARLPPSPARRADPGRAAGLTATFQRLLPWTPGQGACLYRAFVLLGLLRRAGQDAVWVFGVRTWPFSAHCWLQIGDAVLDDDPERVGVYTPILAV